MTTRKFTDDELIECLEAGMKRAEIAERFGVFERSIYKRIAKLPTKGYSPKHDMTRTVPDGFRVKGVSTYYNKEGKPAGQWVKSTADSERQAEMMREVIDAMAEDLPRISPVSVGPHEFLKDLLAVYPIGDAHIGMRSWAEETGADWDLKIAERVQCGAMAALVELTPATEEALIINLGDWFHYDSLEPVTSRSGNVLDVDGRYAKMVHVGIKVMRQCIDSALRKHKRVKVICVIGNHDDTGAIWLSTALSGVYEREPRVTIDTSPAPFMYHKFGKVLIGSHHGHTCKPERLPGVMAADRAKDWGDTEFRYWYIGHVHHHASQEFAGVTVEHFGTLTAKDAYAAWGGYRAQQNMKCIVHHREYGEVARHTINPKMLDGLQ